MRIGIGASFLFGKEEIGIWFICLFAIAWKM